MATGTFDMEDIRAGSHYDMFPYMYDSFSFGLDLYMLYMGCIQIMIEHICIWVGSIYDYDR